MQDVSVLTRFTVTVRAATADPTATASRACAESGALLQRVGAEAALASCTSVGPDLTALSSAVDDVTSVATSGAVASGTEQPLGTAAASSTDGGSRSKGSPAVIAGAVAGGAGLLGVGALLFVVAQRRKRARKEAEEEEDQEGSEAGDQEGSAEEAREGGSEAGSGAAAPAPGAGSRRRGIKKSRTIKVKAKEPSAEDLKTAVAMSFVGRLRSVLHSTTHHMWPRIGSRTAQRSGPGAGTARGQRWKPNPSPLATWNNPLPGVEAAEGEPRVVVVEEGRVHPEPGASAPTNNSLQTPGWKPLGQQPLGSSLPPLQPAAAGGQYELPPVRAPWPRADPPPPFDFSDRSSLPTMPRSHTLPTHHTRHSEGGVMTQARVWTPPSTNTGAGQSQHRASYNGGGSSSGSSGKVAPETHYMRQAELQNPSSGWLRRSKTQAGFDATLAPKSPGLKAPAWPSFAEDASKAPGVASKPAALASDLPLLEVGDEAGTNAVPNPTSFDMSPTTAARDKHPSTSGSGWAKSRWVRGGCGGGGWGCRKSVDAFASQVVV